MKTILLPVTLMIASARAGGINPGPRKIAKASTNYPALLSFSFCMNHAYPVDTQAYHW
jgi:hypothetical protein